MDRLNHLSLIGLMNEELGRKVMIKFVGLRATPYKYLIFDGSEDKKSKRHEKN